LKRKHGAVGYNKVLLRMDIAVWNGGIRVQREMRVSCFVLSLYLSLYTGTS
jgi:hypothetical protein